MDHVRLTGNVKVDDGGSSIDSLISEFPDLTQPTGVQREVRHSTAHHIRTTSGPPVTCRLHRLAPNRLAIATAEIDTLLRTARPVAPRFLGPQPYTSFPRATDDYRDPNAHTVPNGYTESYPPFSPTLRLALTSSASVYICIVLA